MGPGIKAFPPRNFYLPILDILDISLVILNNIIHIYVICPTVYLFKSMVFSIFRVVQTSL